MIFYIHGFGSSGLGDKAKLFRSAFGDALIAPTLPISPDLAIDSLQQLIESFLRYEEVFLVGSSLGGFYGQYLSNRYDLKLVAINPVVDPNVLDKYRGQNNLFYDQTIYEYTPQHFKQLQHYSVKTNEDKVLLMLQKDDETLDYKEAIKAYPKAKKIITSTGGHAFVGIENYFAQIKEFFGC
ncbi:MAG: YqiA/YcfP family alpha/beta fold hydrolase [Campylobacterota bacterium]